MMNQLGSTTSPLLVDPREASRLLCVCEKALWNLTKRGELPAVRIGRSIRYDLVDIRAYISRSKIGLPAVPQSA